MESSKSFINKFKNEISYTTVSIMDITAKINLQRRYYSNLAVVEGITDVVFYGNLDKSFFDNCCFIHACNGDKTHGKTYVLRAYKKVKDDAILSKQRDKLIFMVDKDYDEAKYYQPKDYGPYELIASEDLKNISVTEGYSFENYFFKENNLQEIFKLGGIEDKYESFMKLYRNFCNETKEFFSWFATYVYAIREGFLEGCKVINVDDIFDFNLSKEEYYNKKLMQKAIMERKKYIETSCNAELLKRKQKEYLKLIEKNNWYRGHTLYNLLNAFTGYKLDQYYQNENYIQIINNLDVELNINYANGIKVKV